LNVLAETTLDTAGQRGIFHFSSKDPSGFVSIF